jgi:hypothetical protein
MESADEEVYSICPPFGSARLILLIRFHLLIGKCEMISYTSPRTRTKLGESVKSITHPLTKAMKLVKWRSPAAPKIISSFSMDLVIPENEQKVEIPFFLLYECI